MKVSLICIAVLTVLVHSVSGFTVITKTGERVEGTWITESTSKIWIKDQSGTIRGFEKNNLDFKGMATASHGTRTTQVDQETEKKNTETKLADVSVSVPNAAITEPYGPKPITPNPPSGRLWSVQAVLTNSYDTNINHNEEDLDSMGIVYGAGVRWQSNVEKPAFKIEYEAAKHSYSHTDQWDRISQNLASSYEWYFAKHMSLDIDGEAAIKGSSEDREIGNQYTAEPSLKYKLNKSNRIEFYGAYRLKRYEDDPTRDATNRFVGIVYERRLFSKHEIAFEYRYEENDALSPKHDYYRRRYGVNYTIPFRHHDWVNVGFRFRQQNYHSRLVDINVENGPDLEFLRRDLRYNFNIDCAITLTQNLQLLPGYSFESRNSNDDSKDFSSHFPSLSLLYRWK
jgi:hypothetical protein